MTADGTCPRTHQRLLHDARHRRVRRHRHRPRAPVPRHVHRGGPLRNSRLRREPRAAPLRPRSEGSARRAEGARRQRAPQRLLGTGPVRERAPDAPRGQRLLGGAARDHQGAALQRRMGAARAARRAHRPVRRDRGRVPARARGGRAPGGRARARRAGRLQAPHRHQADAPGHGHDPRRARPLARRRDPLPRAPVRGVRHRHGRRDVAHGDRRPLARHSRHRRPAPLAHDDPRGRAHRRRRHAGRGHRQPRPRGARGVPPQAEPGEARARQAQAPEDGAGGHARRDDGAALRQHRAADRPRARARERRHGHRPLPQRVPVHEPPRPAGRGRAVRGLPRRGRGHEGAPGHHPHPRHRRGQGARRAGERRRRTRRWACAPSATAWPSRRSSTRSCAPSCAPRATARR